MAAFVKAEGDVSAYTARVLRRQMLAEALEKSARVRPEPGRNSDPGRAQQQYPSAWFGHPTSITPAHRRAVKASVRSPRRSRCPGRVVRPSPDSG
ncbi:hypothetical protein GCM10010094_81000 [Streptomyces flaveus]|uniref:Uncharacterized protein n=1 Tax=Streptomyces flaveus TaxID=66370 RepID=A0A917RI05_9ACTN|nr:hypothetical protein GCM10010094_81000 [Streptomyces flaveus]